MPPKGLAKSKEDRPSGVLPVNAAARAAPTKTPAPKLKLEIRRLPPSLSLVEFEEIMGDEWKLGHGKVDWREYRQGKIRSPGKMPEQSRCYVHVTSEALVRELEQKFLSVVFHDKAGTHRNSEIKHLPPILEFAPYQRIPLNQKQRVDSRQGMIDQDPEFIAFLEAETQPIVKPPALDLATAAEETVEVKSTPLIDDLREKKANKAKAATTKAEKKKKLPDDDKRAKSEDDTLSSKNVKDGGKKSHGAAIEQSAKEAAKIPTKQSNKQQHQQQQQQQPNNANAKIPSPARPKRAAQSPKPQDAILAELTPKPSTSSPAPQRVPPGQRPRGNADGIKKMLQKDLGIKPKPASEPISSQQTQAAPSTSTTASTALGPDQAQQPTATSTLTSPQRPATPHVAKNAASSAAALHGTKAFLKHANPSQGMTEMLILRALSNYGEVSNVTIDPRKGTAIAVFKDRESLKKAIEGKKIPVAQGAVEVSEFREAGQRSSGESVRGRGGFRGRGGRSRGGSAGGSHPARVESSGNDPPANSTASASTG